MVGRTPPILAYANVVNSLQIAIFRRRGEPSSLNLTLEVEGIAIIIRGICRLMLILNLSFGLMRNESVEFDRYEFEPRTIGAYIDRIPRVLSFFNPPLFAPPNAYSPNSIFIDTSN